MKIVRSILIGLLALAAMLPVPLLAQTFQSLGSASLSVTTSSGRVALPATTFGNNLTILNVGTNEAFVNFGGAAVTAATTNESVPAGSGRCFAQQGFTNVAAITASSTTTLRISQGTGPCALSYRGGGGAAAGLTVGTSVITGGTDTRVLFDNAGLVGEYAISGTGSVCMTTSCTMVTPTLGAATATSLVAGAGLVGTPSIQAGSATTSGLYSAASNQINISGNGTLLATFGGSSPAVSLVTTNGLTLNGAGATIVNSPATATFQLGAAAAASPVAQTMQSQGSRPATDNNVGGGNFTITSGNGTGTGTLSSLILQSPIAVASGTGAQTQTTGLTIKNGTAITVGYTVATLPSVHVAGARAHVTDQLTTCAAIGVALTGGGAVTCPAFDNGSAWVGG